jgi:chromate reductase
MSQSIAVIVGSLRKDSFNRRLANALARLAPRDWEFNQLRIDDLPLYNQDDDENNAPSVKRLKSEILAADGLLFVTPEYNRSFPGVLKNAIDHGSRPYGKSVWQGKPAGVIGISPGTIGTAVAQHDLRGVLAYLEVPTFAQPEAYLHYKEGFFDSDGGVGSGSREFLQNWVDRFVGFVEEHAAARARQQRKAA